MSKEHWDVARNVDFDAATSDEPGTPSGFSDESAASGEQATLGKRVIRGLLTNKKALVGALTVVLFVLTAVFAPIIAPYNPETTYERIRPPNSYSEGNFDDDAATERVWHVLGTDSFGHDMLSRIVFGARVSLMVAFGTMMFAFIVGTTVGLVAGYYKGVVDTILMRFVDFQWAFPELILAVAIIAFAGGRGIWVVIFAVGIAYIDDFARLIRGEVLSIRETEYVQAARSIGMNDTRILIKEILPNAFAPLIVQATIMIPLAIIAEAGLSFLGLGVKPTTPTWGILVNQGRQFILRAWWVSVMPGFAIMITVLGFNLFGDGLRDILDVEQDEVTER